VRDSGTSDVQNADERSFGSCLLFVLAGVERVSGVVVPIAHALGRAAQRLTRDAVCSRNALRKTATSRGGRIKRDSLSEFRIFSKVPSVMATWVVVVGQGRKAHDARRER
jgi:hypothetical protein